VTSAWIARFDTHAALLAAERARDTDDDHAALVAEAQTWFHPRPTGDPRG